MIRTVSIVKFGPRKSFEMPIAAWMLWESTYRSQLYIRNHYCLLRILTGELSILQFVIAVYRTIPSFFLCRFIKYDYEI